jgi:plastocyanin
VAVTEGSTVLTELTEPGSATNFMATAGNVEVWQYAVAGAQPGTYSLNLSVYQSNPLNNLLSTTQVVNPTPSTSSTSFAFVANLPTAGTYNLVVDDFQFPGSLQSISSPTVAQNGTVLPLTGGDFTALQGPVVVLVDATPPTGSLGIFGVTVQTTGTTPSVVLDQTQAVGGIFNIQTLTVGISGNFAATLADLKFPQAFGTLAFVLSQNSQVLGKAYAEGGSGTFQYNATPGKYVVTLAAIPNSTTTAPPSLGNYGLYSLHVASAAPTVKLSSSAASVAAGGTVTLTWSSQSATSCTAGGGTGWTGSQATSGSLGIVVSATETLTLTCTGPGGSAADSVTVTATAASKSGGGALDPAWLMALGSLWIAAILRRIR